MQSASAGCSERRPGAHRVPAPSLQEVRHLTQSGNATCPFQAEAVPKVHLRSKARRHRRMRFVPVGPCHFCHRQHMPRRLLRIPALRARPLSQLWLCLRCSGRVLGRCRRNRCQSMVHPTWPFRGKACCFLLRKHCRKSRTAFRKPAVADGWSRMAGALLHRQPLARQFQLILARLVSTPVRLWRSPHLWLRQQCSSQTLGRCGCRNGRQLAQLDRRVPQIACHVPLPRCIATMLLHHLQMELHRWQPLCLLQVGPGSSPSFLH